MNVRSYCLRSFLLHLCTVFVLTWMLVPASSTAAYAQSDLSRQTVAVTYPLDQTISLSFRGTTRLPRLKGEAKVRRSGRRGTRVELSIEDLPRAAELGSIYTTYVLWAISPEGRADNLGEIKRGGSFIVNSKIDVTTPLQTFALIVTAEPHFLVRGPSRMVVLENLPPRGSNNAEVATVDVQYIGNTSDYFKESRVPEVADKEYTNTPVSLLGARQAIRLARYAGAERDATSELQEAADQLEQAENAWRLKQDTTEVDRLARRATSLGARAEEQSEARRAARVRREEIASRDEAVRQAEQTAATAEQQIADLRAALSKETRARELSDRDVASSNQQLRDLRSEVARLRDEVQTARAEGEDAKVKLARLEGERSAEVARRESEQRQVRQREAAAALKQTLARYGSISETERGMVLTLPDSLWAGARASELTPAAAAKIEPLAALLANNPDYGVVIEVHTDNRGDEASLQKLTQDRAETLARQFISFGVADTRIQANGHGAAKPLAPNTQPRGRLRNRRTEVMLVPTSATNTASTN